MPALRPGLRLTLLLALTLTLALTSRALDAVALQALDRRAQLPRGALEIGLARARGGTRGAGDALAGPLEVLCDARLRLLAATFRVGTDEAPRALDASGDVVSAQAPSGVPEPAPGTRLSTELSDDISAKN